MPAFVFAVLPVRKSQKKEEKKKEKMYLTYPPGTEPTEKPAERDWTSHLPITYERGPPTVVMRRNL